uniref:Uncharacterized protein n=1 Tax=Amphimedon queenslandica TaxID=400682 RepID=A0A1X7TJQ2_AMPQE
MTKEASQGRKRGGSTRGMTQYELNEATPTMIKKFIEHETFIKSTEVFLSEQRRLKKESLKRKRGFLCPQAVAMEKFLMGAEVQKNMKGISEKKQTDSEYEKKIGRAYL